MRIVMLLANPFRPDPRVLKEAESLSALGYSLTIICWDRAKEFPETENTPAGTRIIRVQSVKSTYGIGSRQILKLIGFWRTVFSYLRKLSPDVIHCHDFDTLPAGLFWGILNHKPVVYDAHEYYAEMVKPRLHGFVGLFLWRVIIQCERIGARLSDAVITVDGNLGAIFRKLNKKVLIIGHYPPINTAELPHAAFNGKEIRIVYAGRISTDRGMIIYIDLLRELSRRKIPVRLILAGVFTPLKEQAILNKYGRGLSGQIEFSEWIPFTQMGIFLHHTDVGLAILLPEPRFVAAVPVKLYEYMAAGLPVIASDFPLIKEIIQNNRCGILVHPDTAVQSAANILEKWWSDWSEPAQMGENGRQAILRKYNWETLVDSLDQLYKDLTKNNKKVL